jgi:hypothetical protein
MCGHSMGILEARRRETQGRITQKVNPVWVAANAPGLTDRGLASQRASAWLQ